MNLERSETADVTFILPLILLLFYHHMNNNTKKVVSTYCIPSDSGGIIWFYTWLDCNWCEYLVRTMCTHTVTYITQYINKGFSRTGVAWLLNCPKLTEWTWVTGNRGMILTLLHSPLSEIPTWTMTGRRTTRGAGLSSPSASRSTSGSIPNHWRSTKVWGTRCARSGTASCHASSTSLVSSASTYGIWTEYRPSLP